MAKRFYGGFKRYRKYRKSGKYRSRRLSKRVKRVERGVKRISRTIETKFFDFSASSVAASTTWSVGNLQAVSLGGINQTVGGSSTNAGRIGRDIKMTNCYLRYYIKGTEESVDANNDFYNTVRVLLVVDKVPVASGSPPAFGDIFVSTGDANINMIQPPNWDKRGRFRIIYDKLHQVTCLANEAGGASAISWDPNRPHTLYGGKRKIKINRMVHYDTTTNNINKNAVWLLIMSDSSAAPNPTISYTCRVKYQDA